MNKVVCVIRNELSNCIDFCLVTTGSPDCAVRVLVAVVYLNGRRGCGLLG